MLIRFAFCLFAATLLLANSGIAADDHSLSTYRLGAGDTISIQVLGEDDLKRQVRLSDAGTISFPFLGELKVKGLTVGELERTITNGLKGRYLLNPIVNVSIQEYRQFFINGQVQKPGGYPFLPGLDRPQSGFGRRRLQGTRVAGENICDPRQRSHPDSP